MRKIGTLLVLSSLCLFNVGCEDKTKAPAPTVPVTKPADNTSGDKMSGDKMTPPPAPTPPPTPSTTESK